MTKQTINLPSYNGDQNYEQLIQAGKISVKANGEDFPISVDINTDVEIKITNNQLGLIFDYEKINFTEKVYDPKLKKRVTIDRSPDEMTDDLMVFKINSSNWDKYISRYTVQLPYLHFKARPTEPVEDYPFLRIYKVDDESLNKLGREVNERRNKKILAPDGSTIKDYDVSGYILDLVRFPYKIDTESELEFINLNNESMESQGYQILNYLQEINLGKIYCKHDMLTNIGYKNIEFNLFVPNFKPINLDVAKVINRTIELKLIVDLTTGQGTLNIMLDGVTFHVEREKITKDIPFRSDSVNVSLNDDVLNTKFINPYLEVIVLNPDNDIDAKELKQRNVQKSSLSYIKSDNIILSSEATYREQLEIEMLLRRGVYINGSD